MKTREKKDRLLVALHLETIRSGFGREFAPAEVADSANIPRQPGELRTWIDSLEGNGFLKVSRYLGGGADGGMHAEITASGNEAAEDLLEEHPEYGTNSGQRQYIPTASILLEEGENLGSLAELVRGSNSGTDTERTAALAEIAIFEASLQQPVVATDLIDRFVNWVLKWITAKFTDAAIATVVGAIIVKLAPFLAT